MTPDSPVHACPQCGRSILAEAEFCPHCGARSERPGRSAFAVLLDWLVTAVVVVLVLIFGLAGACFLLIAVGRGTFTQIPIAIALLAVGIGLLMVAGMLIQYLRRRRDKLRGRTPPAPPTGDR